MYNRSFIPSRMRCPLILKKEVFLQSKDVLVRILKGSILDPPPLRPLTAYHSSSAPSLKNTLLRACKLLHLLRHFTIQKLTFLSILTSDFFLAPARSRISRVYCILYLNFAPENYCPKFSFSDSLHRAMFVVTECGYMGKHSR